MTHRFALPAVVLAAVTCGFVAGTVGSRAGSGLMSLPVAHAITSMANEKFAVCTTTMDGVTDGFFLLDFETGDLTGGVLNQNSAKFTVAYRQNVLKDLGFKPGQVKAPQFLMVPGLISFAGNAGNQFAQSVIYVTDASTGVSVAYGIPWTTQGSNGPTRGGVLDLKPLDVARPRGGVAP
jgi:hypothetical protein